MSKIMFEDELIDVDEDNVIVNTTYDIQRNKLITKKIIERTISSSIYTYEDGISVYLKFDDSGPNKVVNLMFAIFTANAEKKIVETTEWADITVKRINKTCFHIKIEDNKNECGSMIFVTVPITGEITTINLNYTKLTKLEIIDEQVAILGCYEKINEEALWTCGIYNLDGKIKKILVDKKIPLKYKYEMEVENNDRGSKSVLVYLQADGERKAVVKYNFKAITGNDKNTQNEKEDKRGE